MERDNKDKLMLDDILNELDNLKKYSNELASNTRGDKLESYINSMKKNIFFLENNVEKVYDENFKSINEPK